MKKHLARVTLFLILSPFTIAGYIAAWIYAAFQTGWYWGTGNAEKLMVD
jgi:hypothetical protein